MYFLAQALAATKSSAYCRPITRGKVSEIIHSAGALDYTFGLLV